MKTFSKMFLTAVAGAAMLGAQSKPASDPLIQSSHDLFTQISQLVLRSADKIPENLWSYKATPEVRSIGQLFAHIADASNHICASAIDAKMRTDSIEETAKTKAAIVAALKAEFAGCEAAYTKLTPASAVQTIDLNGMKRTRIAQMDYEVAHTWEHYGNLVTYMRLNKIVPPSSEVQH